MKRAVIDSCVPLSLSLSPRFQVDNTPTFAPTTACKFHGDDEDEDP